MHHLLQLQEFQDAFQKAVVIKPYLAEQINYLLQNHNNKELVFTVYHQGHLYEITQQILSIDLNNRIIKGSERNIYIDNITDLKEK